MRKLEPRTAATEKRTLGYDVIDFASDVLKIDLLPWQRWLLVHMLELLPSGELRFRTVVILVARQNGKSTLSQVLALWFMYVYGVKLVIGTAQDLDVAEEIWQGAVDLVQELDDEDEPVRPELAELVDKVVMVNGKKALNLTTGERYKVKAANRRAGRGLSGELILLDELREHQSWDAWGAITKTTMARAQALILALSNAGDASSIVLRYLRQLAIRSLVEAGFEELRAELIEVEVGEDDDDGLDDYIAEGIEEAEAFANDDSLGIFEWSAPPGCDLGDWDGIAQANPALGHTITERAITSARRTDPEWVYRTEVLCQWSEGTLDGPFPPGAWEGSLDPGSTIADDSPIVCCLDVSWDRTMSYVAAAGWRAPDDKRKPSERLPHVEVIAQRSGTDWPVGWFTDPEHPERKKRRIAVQAKGAPASSLIKALRDASLNVVEWGGGDLAPACGAFYDRVRAAVGEGSAEAGLRHRVQPVLDVAAATAATRPLGDAWVWDRKKSPADCSPLMAVTGALWLLTSAPKPKPAARIRTIGGGRREA